MPNEITLLEFLRLLDWERIFAEDLKELIRHHFSILDWIILSVGALGLLVFSVGIFRPQQLSHVVALLFCALLGFGIGALGVYSGYHNYLESRAAGLTDEILYTAAIPAVVGLSVLLALTVLGFLLSLLGSLLPKK